MQSPIFRLVSITVPFILLGALITVIWLVVQRGAQGSLPPTAMQTGRLTPIANSEAPATAVAGAILPNTPTSAPLPANAQPTSTPVPVSATTIRQGRSTVAATTDVVATPTAGVTRVMATRRAVTPTVTFAILQPTPTPTPLTAMRAPLDRSPSPTRGWTVYSNGNHVNAVAVVNNTIWAATNGGVVAWNRSNNAATKYTTLDGLIANRTTTVVYCPLPGFGLVFGTDQGLQIYDIRSERWLLMNSRNSEMHYDDVATLTCNVEDGFLVVGYQTHGLDIFDTENGEWRSVNQQNGLQRDLVDTVTVVGDLDALWVSSGTGISVLTQDSVLFYDERTTPLETNAINVMVSDANGSVWLGAQGKVYAINGETWTIYSPSYVLASQFPTGAITALALADDNTLWIGSDLGELCKFDLDAVTCAPFFTADDLAIESRITALTLDNLGRLYVATALDGVRFYDDPERATASSTAPGAPPTPWRAFTIPSEMRGNQIRAITQDAAGYLWLLTERGLQQWDPATATDGLLFTDANSRYTISTIATLAADHKQGIWVGGQNAGYFDGVGWTNFTTTDGLIDRQVRAIAVDSAQRTWFGTADGLSIWNGDSFFNLTRADGLPGAQITALYVNGQEVWIGTDNGLLRFVDNRLQIFTTATTRLPSNAITALARDEEGAILIGTNGGLARFLNTTISVIPEFEGEPIHALAILPGNAIWVATATQGVRYFNGLRWTAPPNGVIPPAAIVAVLFVDREGALWMGGDGGLLRYVP